VRAQGVRRLMALHGKNQLWSEVVEPMPLVLLGCRVIGPAALSPPGRRRALRAKSALQAGLTQQILACGGKSWNGVRETDALCAFLIEQGVPPLALERESNSRSTRQNARYAAQLLLPRGHRRIWLVTCDWHMARALRCFEGAGFQPEPLPARCPPIPVGQTLLRTLRERACLGLDSLLTRGFSRL
jgi:uncharacterized SAM-binding protein YcdF (DUF218 family)